MDVMGERVEVVRRPTCPGVELVRVFQSARVWSHLNATFAFGSLRDWSGSLNYRRDHLPLPKGETFLFEPGEFFSAGPTDGKAGSFSVLEVQPQTLEALCRIEGHAGPVHFGRATISTAPLLTAALTALEQAILSDVELLELQSRMAELANAAMSTVLEEAPRRERTHAIPLGCCQRLRDVLHSSDGAQLNLHDFAQEAGISQYRLLRAFKRRYGAPPHAYGLHVRVERARQMLQRGYSVAEAAAAADFADQSHFFRHFQRIWGLSPGQYAVGAFNDARRRRKRAPLIPSAAFTKLRRPSDP